MMASAMPPSVTSSWRIFIAMGVTDEGQHGIELTPEMLDLVPVNRDARKTRDPADSIGVNGHTNGLRFSGS